MDIDLLAFFGDLELWQWLSLGAGATGWLSLTAWLGHLTDKLGGDRESGALVGFCLPGLIALLVWWLV